VGGTAGSSFSPDGARIASQRRAVLSSEAVTTTGQQIVALCGHEGEVKIVTFSADGARIVTASYDHTARLWDTITGREITRIVLDALVTGLSVLRGAIALGDALGRIHVFEAEDFLCVEGSASDGPGGPEAGAIRAWP
jgi:WD40 repeat protein